MFPFSFFTIFTWSLSNPLFHSKVSLLSAISVWLFKIVQSSSKSRKNRIVFCPLSLSLTHNELRIIIRKRAISLSLWLLPLDDRFTMKKSRARENVWCKKKFFPLFQELCNSIWDFKLSQYSAYTHICTTSHSVDNVSLKGEKGNDDDRLHDGLVLMQ